MLIDIHCHLDHCYFNDDREKVIKNAQKADLKVILTAGINPKSNRKALEFAKNFDIIRPCLGIYPVEVLKKEMESVEFPMKAKNFDVDEEISFIKTKKETIAGIGEVGLDYHIIKNEEADKRDN